MGSAETLEGCLGAVGVSEQVEIDRDGVMRQGWKEREVAPASVDRRKILRVSSLRTIGTIKRLSRDMANLDLLVKGFFWNFYEGGMEGARNEL